MNDADSETPPSQHAALLEAAHTSAVRYLDGLRERAAGASAPAIDNLKANLPKSWPEKGMADAAILDLLDTLVAPATVASAGPRYFGFVTGGALPIGLAANWLAGAWDQNAFSMASSPASVLVEERAAAWLLEALDLDASAATAFVTGATMANFCGLAAARHAILKRAGWDVERDGLYGAPPLRVVVGEEAHPALLKALGFLGLGRARVEHVPVDSEGRMRSDSLPAMDTSTIVCAQAGNVNSGAFDPLRAIGEAARKAGAWMHVDGAFGIWARATPRLAHLADGAELADSIATDAHKWLNVPYDCGVVVVRSSADLNAAMSIGAAYLPTAEVREPLHFTPESSRRARGLEVWAVLASLGRDGLADLIDRNCALAARMSAALKAAGLEVLNEVSLNQVVVAFGDAQHTEQVVSAVQADGTCWCGPTHWQGQPAMRISVSSWATTAADIDRSAAAIVRIAASI